VKHHDAQKLKHKIGNTKLAKQYKNMPTHITYCNLKTAQFSEKFTQIELTACQKMCAKVWLITNFKHFAVQSLK